MCIRDRQITVHCTITRQQSRAGYVTEFAEFWNANPDTKGIWFSLYTPQRGEDSPERLLPEDRARVVAEIQGLHKRLPKLRDMRPSVLEGYLKPPQDPASCIGAHSEAHHTAGLKRRIGMRHSGSAPNCSQCG